MPQVVIDAPTKHAVVEELARMLNYFHEAEKRKEGGLESVSRRGHLGGYRWALTTMLGRKATGDILEEVREKTHLGFPHVGPVQDDGSILGMDSEAAFGL
jgi:hypothetical protein